jgi:hypothetical protein
MVQNAIAGLEERGCHRTEPRSSMAREAYLKHIGMLA